MSIKTTCVICEEVFALLAEAEEKTGRTMIDLVIAAMRMMLRNHKQYDRTHGRIEYQKRFDVDTGKRIVKHRMKLNILEREYDYFQDMRKIFRRSISLVMAIAVRTYLSEIVERILNKKYDEDADNYPFQNYAILDNCIDGITTFRIWWGLPADLETLLQ